MARCQNCLKTGVGQRPGHPRLETLELGTQNLTVPAHVVYLQVTIPSFVLPVHSYKGRGGTPETTKVPL